MQLVTSIGSNCMYFVSLVYLYVQFTIDLSIILCIYLFVWTLQSWGVLYIPIYKWCYVYIYQLILCVIFS